MCNFYIVKMSLFGRKVSFSLHKKWHITHRGGWWLKWKPILSRWRIEPLFENWVTFVIDFQKIVCGVLSHWHFGRKILSKRSRFMHIQITSFSEWLVTIWANKWPLSSVGPFLNLQSTTLCEWQATFWTRKGLLSCVGPFMPLQWTTFYEWLVTFWTSEGLVFTFTFMHLQFTTFCEWLVTFVTR